jgi:hypothetical protein
MNDLTNDSSRSNLPAAPRRRKPIARNYRTALQEPGACRLTTEELDTVTKALAILESKVIRKLGAGVIWESLRPFVPNVLGSKLSHEVKDRILESHGDEDRKSGGDRLRQQRAKLGGFDRPLRASAKPTVKRP